MLQYQKIGYILIITAASISGLSVLSSCTASTTTTNKTQSEQSKVQTTVPLKDGQETQTIERNRIHAMPAQESSQPKITENQERPTEETNNKADTTWPQTPSRNGYSFLGFSIIPGFVRQPSNQNIIMSDNGLTISARLAPSHTINSLGTTKEIWELWESIDGKTYKKVDSTSKQSFLFTTQIYNKTLSFSKLKITKPGDYKFQFKVRTPQAIGLWDWEKFYSNPFTVHVSKNEIHATNIMIDQGNSGAIMKKDERDLTATLIPKTSTDSILWTSLNPNIASVEKNTGLVTAKQKGTTIITATAKNRAGGVDAYATYKLTVSGGLNDLKVVEGTDGIFKIIGLNSDGLYDIKWYKQKGSAQNPRNDELLKNSQHFTINKDSLTVKKASLEDNKTKYYAVIQTYINVEKSSEKKPVGDPFNTDTATLTVVPDTPKITSIGDFNFGKIKLSGRNMHKSLNADTKISIHNVSQKNWKLYAQQLKGLHDNSGTPIPLVINKKAIDKEATLIFTHDDKNIKHNSGNDNIILNSKSNVYLDIPQNIHIGNYKSETLWTLEDAPS